MIRRKMTSLAAGCLALAAGCSEAPDPTPPPPPTPPAAASTNPAAKPEKVEPLQSNQMQP